MSEDWRIDLWKACCDHGEAITGITLDGAIVDGALLLWSIAGNESSFGADRLVTRVEPAYGPGGRYFERSPVLRSFHKRYGDLAASSVGSFQLMYPTATEVGYVGHPLGLQVDDVGAKFATALIMRRFVRHGAKTLEQVLDAYNTGTFKDKNVPTDYVRKAVRTYRAALPKE